MNHRIFEGWLSSVCGVFGFGFAWTNFNWAEDLPKILISVLSATLADAMGYVGKLFAVWSIRRLKSSIQKLKKQK